MSEKRAKRVARWPSSTLAVASGTGSRLVVMSLNLDDKSIVLVDLNGERRDCFCGTLEQLAAAVRCAPLASPREVV